VNEVERSRVLVFGLRLLKTVAQRGVLDAFLRPSSAFLYWKRILALAATSPEGMASGHGLPVKSLDEILPGASEGPVNLSEYRYEYGDMPLGELLTLCRLVRAVEGELVFEIGTFNGGTALQLAANSQGRVLTLDLPPDVDLSQLPGDPDQDVYPERTGHRFLESPYTEKIQQLFGNSQTFDFSPYFGKVDFVFVDGCHHYEYVMCDSRNALRLTERGGIVAWHDYATYSPGVIRALNELGREHDLVHLRGTSIVVWISPV